MARLPTLVSIIADRDSREQTTIEQMARFIREAGYVATTKRGLGASEMTAKDAANLLIGITAAESPKNAAIEVARKSTLRRHTLPRYAEVPEPFDRIDRAETFGEAMEALIAGARAIEACFHAWIDRVYTQFDNKQREALKRDFTLFGGIRVIFRPASTQIVVFTQGERGEEIEYDFRYVTDADLLMKGFYGSATRGYRKVSVEIGFDIILDIAKAITPEVQGDG